MDILQKKTDDFYTGLSIFVPIFFTSILCYVCLSSYWDFTEIEKYFLFNIIIIPLAISFSSSDESILPEISLDSININGARVTGCIMALPLMINKGLAELVATVGLLIFMFVLRRSSSIIKYIEKKGDHTKEERRYLVYRNLFTDITISLILVFNDIGLNGGKIIIHFKNLFDITVIIFFVSMGLYKISFLFIKFFSKGRVEFMRKKYEGFYKRGYLTVSPQKISLVRAECLYWGVVFSLLIVVYLNQWLNLYAFLIISILIEELYRHFIRKSDI